MSVTEDVFQFEILSELKLVALLNMYDISFTWLTSHSDKFPLKSVCPLNIYPIVSADDVSHPLRSEVMLLLRTFTTTIVRRKKGRHNVQFMLLPWKGAVEVSWE